MKRIIYVVLLFIFAAGIFYFLNREDSPSRFVKAGGLSQWYNFENFYQNKAVGIFPAMREEILIYSKLGESEKAQGLYADYMRFIDEYRNLNDNQVNVFSELVRREYHSFSGKRILFSFDYEKINNENDSSEFGEWLDAPLEKKILYGNADEETDIKYQRLSAEALIQGACLYGLYKKTDREGELEGMGRSLAMDSFLYYLLVCSGEIEMSRLYESALFGVYKMSRELGFCSYYKDPLPRFPENGVKYNLPSSYVGMSEWRYRILVRRFICFLEKGC